MAAAKQSHPVGGLRGVPGYSGRSQSCGVQRTHHRDIVLFAVSGVRAGDALGGDGAAVLGRAAVEGVAVVGRRP